MIAAGAGHLAILQILLEKDPDVNARDSSAHTALIWGILGGDVGVVEALLGAGADPD